MDRRGLREARERLSAGSCMVVKRANSVPVLLARLVVAGFEIQPAGRLSRGYFRRMRVLEKKKTWKAPPAPRRYERASDITEAEAKHLRAAMAVLRVRHAFGKSGSRARAASTPAALQIVSTPAISALPTSG